MNKIKNFVTFIIFFLIVGCSFDKKTGIWSGSEKEKQRISDLQKEQSEIIDISKISEQKETEDVPNGIAWDKVNDKIFITGKNWNFIYMYQKCSRKFLIS